MPWDFFCPICSNTLDGDMTEDEEEMDLQCKELMDDLYHCSGCNFIVSFQGDIIDLSTFIPENKQVVKIHAITYCKTSKDKNGGWYSLLTNECDEIKIKDKIIVSLGEYNINGVLYKIVE